MKRLLIVLAFLCCLLLPQFSLAEVATGADNSWLFALEETKANDDIGPEVDINRKTQSSHGLLHKVFLRNEWSGVDKALGVVSHSLIVVDWRMTSYIAKHSDKFYEKYNPMIGRHPSQGRVNAYFISALLLHQILGAQLPSEKLFEIPRRGVILNENPIPISWRNLEQLGVIGLKATYIAINFDVGIKLEF